MAEAREARRSAVCFQLLAVVAFEVQVPGDLLVFAQWRPADTLTRIIEPATMRAVEAEGLALFGSYPLKRVDKYDGMVILPAVRAGQLRRREVGPAVRVPGCLTIVLVYDAHNSLRRLRAVDEEVPDRPDRRSRQDEPAE